MSRPNFGCVLLMIETKADIQTNGLSGMIVPGATIPYSGEIADDFAVNAVEIIYSIKEDTGEDVS